MKIFKKLLIAVSVLVLCLSLFACNKGNGQESKSTSSKSLVSLTEQSTAKSTVTSNSQTVSSTPQSTATSNSQAVNSSPSGTVTSSSGNGQSVKPEVGNNLTYSQKIDAYLDGATIGDAQFVSFVKNLGEFDNNAPIKSNAIFVAPEATGEGSLNDPCSLQDAIDMADAGQTIYLRQGTYDANKEGSFEGYFLACKGNKDNYITIRNYPNEKPVITNSYVNNNKGKESSAIIVETTCEYVVLEGLEIANVKSHCAYGICMWDGGQNHLVIRNCSIHDIKTTSSNPNTDTEAGANAILLFGATDNSLNNMFIMDNEIYNTVTGWAETLSVTANAEYIYVLCNNVHNTSNIAIDFYGNANYGASPKNDQPRYCVAAANVISNSYCEYADCAGLYVDGARDIILQYNTITNCQYGIEVGSEEKQENYPVKNIVVRSNLVHDNLIVGIRVGGYETNATGVVYSTAILNNTLYNNTKGSNPSGEIVLAKVDGISFVNNIIQTENAQVSLVMSEFNDSYTKNVSFYNNIFYATGKTKDNAEFSMYSSWQEGLNKFEQLLADKASGNYYGKVAFDNQYIPTFDTAFVSKSVENVGAYDYYLNKRVNGNLDIGAVEK